MKEIEDLSLNEIDALLDERVLLIDFLESKRLLFEFMEWRSEQSKSADS